MSIREHPWLNSLLCISTVFLSFAAFAALREAKSDNTQDPIARIQFDFPSVTPYRSQMKSWSHCCEVEQTAGVVSGAVVFRGTRVPVQALFANLEDGATVDDFLEWFPGVKRHQIEAVLEFASEGLGKCITV